MLADDLKKIADEVNAKKLDAATAALVAKLKIMANEQACLGGTKTSLWASQGNFSKYEAESAAKELEKFGFKCEVTDEITAQYSNTDYDSEYIITVSWG